MTTTQQFQITDDGLTVTRTFPVPREAVYAAWTTPEQFAVWFGSEAVDVPHETLSLDVRVGGAWEAVMHVPDGRVIQWVGEYVELDPPSRIVMTMNDDPSQPAGEPLVVTFAEVDGGTEMVLFQPRQGFSDGALEGVAHGYQAFFDAMAGLLAD